MTDGQKEIYIRGLNDGKAIARHVLETVVKSGNKVGGKTVYSIEEIITMIRSVK
jgi:hypothetical protein